MKLIENRKFKNPITLGQSDIQITEYVQLIQVALNNPPEGGFQIEQMRERIKISEVIIKASQDSDGNKKDTKKIEFEDSHIKIIQGCVNTLRWGGLNPEIVDFNDYINTEIKDVESK